jgi:DNA recombination protein RmuC
VEYAVKLPTDDGSAVYLPIDSKFPADLYSNLQDAYESGAPEAIAASILLLTQRIRQEAAKIRDKYIDPPNTTDFAIMFLPFEGLYAEVVNRGLVEDLQRSYRVNIAGPSTMAALLNSLQMGFRSFAIQKRSSEVWRVLGAVKTEFQKFGNVLASSRKRLQQVDDDLEQLIGTRTRAITRNLRAVEQLDERGASLVFGALPEADESETEEE